MQVFQNSSEPSRNVKSQKKKKKKGSEKDSEVFTYWKSEQVQANW